jgi:hypothetical protein
MSESIKASRERIVPMSRRGKGYLPEREETLNYREGWRNQVEDVLNLEILMLGGQNGSGPSPVAQGDHNDAGSVNPASDDGIESSQPHEGLHPGRGLHPGMGDTEEPDTPEQTSTFVATFESRNFSFMATGATASMAETALQNGLREHAAQYGLPRNWWQPYRDDFRIVECPQGQCLRDNEPLVHSGEAVPFAGPMPTADEDPDEDRNTNTRLPD